MIAPGGGFSRVVLGRRRVAGAGGGISASTLQRLGTACLSFSAGAGSQLDSGAVIAVDGALVLRAR
ncbi:MAG: hypothetical protein ABSD97_15905 [Acidimicrobiales bacterium]